MYDIKSLEDNWNRYNKKKRRFWYLTIISLLILSAGTYFLYYENLLLNKHINTSDKIVKKLKDVNSTNDVSVGVKKVIKKVVAKPIEISNDNPMDSSDIFVDEKIEEKKSVSKKIHFQMVDADDPIAYKEVEHRFTVSPNIDDSIFLANIYYNKKSYSKAAYWALQTNKIDGSIEESWLIFADSKYKIGQKNEAIRVLSEYVNKSNSIKAKKLLIKLKQ